MRIFKQLCRTIMLLTAVWLSGCVLEDNPDDKNNGGAGTLSCGTRECRTVTIGGQTWMVENLNRRTNDGSWCFANSTDSCSKYGRLYTWMVARTVCPRGWHLPSRQEWQTLVDFAGGDNAAGMKLKSTSGWNNNGNGTDDYGFSALPGGKRFFYGSFGYASTNGYWWTATEDGTNGSYLRILDSGYYGADKDEVAEYLEYFKDDAYSVRCVAD